MFKTLGTLGWTWKFSFLTIKNTKILRVKSVEYDVERHQEIHRKCIEY
jgi:hypothetical protein